MTGICAFLPAGVDVKRTFPVASTGIEPGIGGHYSFSFGRR
jgi:hypothetical protein